MQIPIVYSGAAFTGGFPGLWGTENVVPEGECTALQGPYTVNRTSCGGAASGGIPEDAVKIRFFLQRQPLSFPGKRNPSAPGLHKSSIIHPELICQPRKIIFRKVDEAAFMSAAGRTSRTGKLKSVSVKRSAIIHSGLSITREKRKGKREKGK
jgi:hypothetical protein